MTHTLQRLWARIVLRLKSTFDPTVDGIVHTLAATAAGLDQHIANKEAVVKDTKKVTEASFARVKAVEAAEFDLRTAAYSREDAANLDLQRAFRIREKIRALLD